MLKRTLAAASIAAIASVFTFGATSVPAATIFGAPAVQTATDNNIQLADTVVKKKVVKKKNGDKVVTKKVVKTNNNKKVTRTTVTRYDAGRHGKRYRHRDGAYVYYYDGYYYDRPWWTIAVPGVNLCIGC